MNAQLRSIPPISPALTAPPRNGQHAARRCCVGDFRLDTGALEQFNELLAKLHHVPILRDQLATAARELAREPLADHYPVSIGQRMQLAATLDHMIADPAWEPANEAAESARLVVDYVHNTHDLIPDTLPLFGRLDDAIVIDAAWPQLAREVGSYLDYCRLRAVEAELKGCTAGSLSFNRSDWQKARRSEAGLIAHCRRVGASSYLPASGPAYFSVR